MAKKDIEAMSLAELFEHAKSLATKSNKAFEEGDFKGAFDTSSELSKVVDQYGETKKEELFCALQKTDSPLLEAVKQLTYEVIIVKESVPDGKHYKTKEIDTRDRAIDLIALDKYCGGGIGDNPEWVSAVEFLGVLAGIKYAKGYKNKDVIKELKSTKAFNNLSAELKEKILNGKTPEAVLEKAPTDVLNAIIETMLGKGYATEDTDFANWLIDNCGSKGRDKLTTNISTKRKIAGLLAECAHGIIFDIHPTVVHKFK